MTGVQLIEKERIRQTETFDAKHDDGHWLGELSMAGAAYANVSSAMIRGASPEEFPYDMMASEGDWPWDEEDWKLSNDIIINLVKAGALIAAEIDRIQRWHQ